MGRLYFKMNIIESTILPRVLSSYEQNIPKIIYQTFKSNDLPDHMFNNAKSFIDLNPEYQYEYYDDVRMAEYINNYDCSNFNFTNDDLRKAFNSITVPAGKADLWRYLIIYETGGVYVDIDAKCLKPLKTVIKPNDHIVTCITGWAHNFDNDKVVWKHLFPQWILIHTKKSVILKKIIEASINAIHTRTPIPGSDDCANTLERYTGACVSNYVYRNIFKFKSIQQELRLRPGTLNITYENNKYQLTIVDYVRKSFGNSFDNTILEKSYDIVKYHTELKKVGSPHWLYQENIFND